MIVTKGLPLLYETEIRFGEPHEADENADYAGANQASMTLFLCSLEKGGYTVFTPYMSAHPPLRTTCETGGGG
jgi:hypothetical protein